MIFISHNPVNLVNPVKNDFLCLSLCSLWLKPDSHTSSHGRNFIGCVPMFSKGQVRSRRGTLQNCSFRLEPWIVGKSVIAVKFGV
jgi:hypothetical protein